MWASSSWNTAPTDATAQCVGNSYYVVPTKNGATGCGSAVLSTFVVSDLGVTHCGITRPVPLAAGPQPHRTGHRQTETHI